ncbi:diguanylate cyclase [Acidaminobacter sp. JC074]|uniref:GGDEF domain-containing protein n=1 Tax=Acidaminobacter sp. JC074 TaxID=2530199 RepID=UPI001F0F0B48|nr:GGDEF domain-containing protein [Acidaminobacter sp. JC074]MCH4888832.1 diguanylate cyclase [Acidaminobacter sp. JC074]
MQIEFSRIVFSSFEALIYLCMIHLILPKNTRNNWTQNLIMYVIIWVASFFFLKESLLGTLAFSTTLILSIFWINKVNVYVASITVVFAYLLNTISSLISIVFGIFAYKSLIDYRFVLEGYDYKVILLKFAISIIVVYTFKVFNSLINRKIKIQKINPRPVFFLDLVYIVLIIFLSCELIEYLPTVYNDVLGIESLNNLLFIGISMLYVASAFVIYITNVYLFKSSDYLSIKLSSETDALTGVYNRKAGINYLKERMQNVQHKKSALTICFIDVNNLKDVNDKYGHKAGDRLIISVANIIKDGLREGDEVSRLGGDEFLVLFDNCTIEQAVRAWDRIIEKFETYNLTSEEVFDISVSVGFAEYNHKLNISHDTLIELADTEMYKNKQRYKRLKGKRRNAKW